MSTTTTNYSFIKPAVNSSTDEDLWGTEWNTNADSIDTDLYAVSQATGGAYTTIASGSTVDLSTSTTANVFITGTTTITSFGTAASGTTRYLRFQQSLTVTYNVTNLITPTAASITTAANSTLRAVSLGSGNWVVTDLCPSTPTSLAASVLTSGILGSGVGVAATSYAKGTVSSGTYTPLYSDGNFQHYTNNGAHTLAPPANICTIVIQCLNGASAGTITTSGFTKVTGDTLTTTNASKFQLSIIKTNDYSSLTVLALQ